MGMEKKKVLVTIPLNDEQKNLLLQQGGDRCLITFRPADSPLWDLDNLILTPHVAGHFFLPETVNRIVRIAASNLQAWLDGEPMRNVTRHG